MLLGLHGCSALQLLPQSQISRARKNPWSMVGPSFVYENTCASAHHESSSGTHSIMKGYIIMITTINALVSNLLRRKSGQRLGCLLQTKMNISKESSPQTRSFYRRALPPSCTALSSEEGKALFESSLAHKGLKSFFQLIEQL